MIQIPVQHSGNTVIPITITIEPCSYCGTHEAPEDRDGLLSCPNCGYPLAQDIPLIDEWATLLPDHAEPLDEASWAALLTEAETLIAEAANAPSDDTR